MILRALFVLLALLPGLVALRLQPSLLRQRSLGPRFLSFGGAELDSGVATSAILAVGALGAGINFLSYAKLQLETAQIVGGIPKNSLVCEMDAQDGKNVFYLPPGVEYTAVMRSSSQSKEKAAINEQLILESVGKANGALASATTGGGLRGKLRAKTQDVRPKSQDVVLSIGALGRCGATEDKALAVNEAFRMLKPGGLFVFLEPGGEDVLELVSKFFPLVIEEPVAAQAPEDAASGGGGGGKKAGRRKSGSGGGESEESTTMSAPATTGARTRPGIVAAPIDVPLRKFISGIAVRP